MEIPQDLKGESCATRVHLDRNQRRHRGNKWPGSPSPRGPRRFHFLQPPPRLVESRVGLREAEPHLLAAQIRVAVETAARHDRHADFPDQVTRKVNVAWKTEARN